MAWPTPQDYNEAIQNPRICFSDPELRRGSTALTPLGLPRPITGGFASVYRLDCPDRRWAVRCFLREYPDQQKRYAAISRYLQAARLSCMVGFEYLERGILIRGKWHPILKMEWIDGEPINDYIASNLKHPTALRSLSSRWADLIGSLRRAGVAHGDLQHGNILVTGGELKLIDYDAMFVPALAGLESHEEGHRNYQHPGRTGRDYDADLDNFSAWVILASINALTIAPDLWDRLEAGDECLLFRNRDFISPDDSKLFKFADQCLDPHVRKAFSALRTFLSLPAARVPALDRERLDGDPPPNRPNGHGGSTTSRGLPEWLRGQVPHPDQASQHQESGRHQPPAPPGQLDLIVTPRLGVAEYGLRFKKADVQKYFDERWTSVTLILDGVAHEFKLYNKFRSSNPAIRGEPIEDWLSKRRLLPLDKDDPPKLIVRIVGSGRFQLIEITHPV